MARGKGRLYSGDQFQTESMVSEKPPEKTDEKQTKDQPKAGPPREIGGPKGPEPTRYNDWEKGGRCVDF